MLCLELQAGFIFLLKLYRMNAHISFISSAVNRDLPLEKTTSKLSYRSYYIRAAKAASRRLPLGQTLLPQQCTTDVMKKCFNLDILIKRMMIRGLATWKLCLYQQERLRAALPLRANHMKPHTGFIIQVTGHGTSYSEVK